jgi:hypothetical protein
MTVSSGNQQTTFDVVIPGGRNFAKAQFRLWHAEKAGILRGVVVLMPGSGYDGRPWTADPFWQELASRHQCALMASYFIDKPHADMNLEDYVNVSQGSGGALLCSLIAFAACSGHQELATAPLAFWGFSAGGEFNYEFAAWDPERVIAFIVNKGGVYYTALTCGATRKVPGMLFVGEKDTEVRINTILGLFSVNRGPGALWAFAAEPGADHEIGRSQEMGGFFLDQLIPLRLPITPTALGQPPVLRPIDEQSGYIGNLTTLTYEPAASAPVTTYPTAFLPTFEIARAWQAFSRGEPFPSGLLE